MKKLFFTLSAICFLTSIHAQLPTGYPTSSATNDDDECIHEVQLGPLTNNSGCVGASAAAYPAANGLPASAANMYANYTSATWSPPVLTPASSQALNMKIGYEANNTWAYSHGFSVFIDYNRNGTFDLPGEKVGGSTAQVTAPTGCNTSDRNITFTVPNSISVGQTLMRIVVIESNATPGPSGTYGWGETEDYIVFLGQKKWDYSMGSMIGPDSISFCAQLPVIIKAKVNNVENQPIPGGRVDLYIKGIEPGSTTNLFYNKSFTQTVANGASMEVDFPPILFPKDELLEFKYVITHPLDSNKSNDTLIKYVQVYKNPVYKLKSDTVCADSFNTVQIYDKPLPLFHKWNNESIVDLTTYTLATSTSISVQISRGWKCNVVDSIRAIVKPLPRLTMARDTVLCNGQTTNLVVSMNLPGFVRWDANNLSSLPVSTSGQYPARGIANNGCQNTGFTTVTIVNPPAQPQVLDTVCAGDVATVGLNNPITGFLYKWTGRTETTPLINPIPTVASGIEKYYVQWWYQGCTSRDTVSLKVNPLPNVTMNFPAPICPYFSSTIVASGAQQYEWRNGLGTGTTKTVSPMTTTDYYVKGTDQNGCWKEVMHRQFVYPTPEMIVYSNKKNDNVCLGDSATIYVNGGKTYSWSTGSTDSILKLIPTESFQWTMIGTDKNGCKDTLSYRMNVKPAFSISYDKTITGCEGDVKRLTASGAKEYDWGQGPTADAFNDVTLINSTSYQVTAMSPHDCQIVVTIPVTVLKKPVGQLSDLTICKGETGQLEAKGGVSYDWTINGQTFITPNGPLGTYTHNDSATIGVEVTNIAGCKDTAYTTVNVINTDKLEVVFKSPLDSYNCASPKIPITLSATPVGGIWSGGSYVTGNKMSPEGLSGTYQVLYTFFEPINNCKVERIKNVKFKCTSGIKSIDNYADWSVYPMPFSDKLTVKYTSEKSEDAQLYIYDLSGREVYHYTHRLLPGENLIDLANLQLAKGTYYLDFQTESVSRQAKMIAQ